MSLIDNLDRTASETQAQIDLNIEADLIEGATDFAFGKMPRHPHSSHYMKGWLEALRDKVSYEDGGVG
jgi:hypothetical protein